MATVRELSDPYLNHLVSVLPRGHGVCTTCWSVVEGPYQRCFPCKSHRDALGARVADVVVPIALAVKREQLAHELWHYKNSPNRQVQERLAVQLAAVLWRFLAMHEACVARACGVNEFAHVAIVPSAGDRPGPHPLARVVGGLVGPTKGRYAEVLRPNPLVLNDRVLRRDRYEATRQISGEPVLLVDDTWTTGSHVQAAVVALREAGATDIGVVVIGRHFDRGYRDHNEYYVRAKKLSFSWETCCPERPVSG